VPARLIGVKPTKSRRDKLTTSVVSSALGVTVSAPPYILGRVGLLMLGSKALLIPGIVFIAVGVTLQAGATGAVRAIKMSASLTGTRTHCRLTTAISYRRDDASMRSASDDRR
jgi:hypothetical protein